MDAVTEAELAPIRRPLPRARSNTGQAGRVADALLARSNATDCGGLDDLTTRGSLDPVIRGDVLLAIDVIALHPEYPAHDGLAGDFAALVAPWRPQRGRPVA